MDCPKCGEFVHKTAIKCPACGHQLKQAAPLPAKPKPRPRPPKPATAEDDLVKAALGGRQVDPGAKQKPKPAPRPASAPAAAAAEGEPEKPVVYTAPAAVRSLNFKRQLKGDLIKVSIGGVILAGAFFSPPGQAAYGNWTTRRAVEGLVLEAVEGAAINGGSAGFRLPAGAEKQELQGSKVSFYRVSRQLDLGLAGKTRLEFSVFGQPDGLEEALARGVSINTGTKLTEEAHNLKKFKTVQFKLPPSATDGLANKMACYYQLADKDESFFSIAIVYDPKTNDPRAIASAIDRVLGTVEI